MCIMNHRDLWKTVYGKLISFAGQSAVRDCAITAHQIDPNKHLIHCFLVRGTCRDPEDVETKKSIGLIESTEDGQRAKEGGRTGSNGMIACIEIKFLYQQVQDIGESVNIQLNQYQQNKAAIS